MPALTTPPPVIVYTVPDASYIMFVPSHHTLAIIFASQPTALVNKAPELYVRIFVYDTAHVLVKSIDPK